MDNELRIDIMCTVRRAMQDALEGAQEVWLTGEQVTQQFGMFTRDWLRRYGDRLPRTQAIVRDSDGVEHKTGWAYPRNKIQKMIRENKIKEL